MEKRSPLTVRISLPSPRHQIVDPIHGNVVGMQLFVRSNVSSVSVTIRSFKTASSCSSAGLAARRHQLFLNETDISWSSTDQNDVSQMVDGPGIGEPKNNQIHNAYAKGQTRSVTSADGENKIVFAIGPAGTKTFRGRLRPQPAFQRPEAQDHPHSRSSRRESLGLLGDWPRRSILPAAFV